MELQHALARQRGIVGCHSPTGSRWHITGSPLTPSFTKYYHVLALPCCAAASFQLAYNLLQKIGNFLKIEKRKLPFLGAGKNSCLLPPFHWTVWQPWTKGSTMSQALDVYNYSSMGDHTHSQASVKKSHDYINHYKNSRCSDNSWSSFSLKWKQLKSHFLYEEESMGKKVIPLLFQDWLGILKGYRHQSSEQPSKGKVNNFSKKIENQNQSQQPQNSLFYMHKFPSKWYENTTVF